MKKKIISSIILTSVLLCGCSTKEAKSKEKDEDETVKTEETEKTEDTEETGEASESEEPTEPTETTEKTNDVEPTEPAPDVNVGFWIDSNLNFGCDADDAFYINMDQVSMKEYFDALESDEIFRSAATFSKITSSPLGFIEKDEYLSGCDYITTTQVELESPGIVDGAVSTDTVRIDEENCVTYYKVDIPQIDLGTSDCDKANKEIIEFVEDYDPWFGMPTICYRFFEHEDGSKTFVFFYGDGYDDSMFKSFSFDSNGKRMSTDDIIKSAGWEPSEFKDKTLELLNTDLAYANNFDVHLMYGIRNSTVIDSVNEDPDVFVNENGNLVVVMYVDFFAINGFYMIPYEVAPDLEISDAKADLETDYLAELDWKVEMYQETAVEIETVKFTDSQEVKIDDIDVSTVPDGLYGATAKYGTRFFSAGFPAWFIDENDNTYYGSIISYLNENVYEDSEYKYEVYRNGELVLTDTIKAEATPFFRQINAKFELEYAEDDVFCVVLYDANGSDNILGAGWDKMHMN